MVPPKGAYNVAVMFDRCRITSCSCTCGAGAKWCAHVVALCLFRIHNVGSSTALLSPGHRVSPQYSSMQRTLSLGNGSWHSFCLQIVQMCARSCGLQAELSEALDCGLSFGNVQIAKGRYGVFFGPFLFLI